MFLLSFAIFSSALLLLLVYYRRRQKCSRTCLIIYPSTDSAKSPSSFKNLFKVRSNINSNYSLCNGNVKKEIIEITMNKNISDALINYKLDCRDTLFIFIKNQKQAELFPNLAPFKATLLFWEKTESKICKNLVYLEESIEKLRDLIFSQ